MSVITLFTERGASPFFLLHVFVISSVSVRWGLAATVRVTVVPGARSTRLLLWVASRYCEDDLTSCFRRAHLVRPVYLLVLGYLIGYLGEHERRSKRKLGFMLDLTAAVPTDAADGPRARAAHAPRARVTSRRSTALLVLRDPGERPLLHVGRHAPRDAQCASGSASPSDDPSPLPFAAQTEGFLAQRPPARHGGAPSATTS